MNVSGSTIDDGGINIMGRDRIDIDDGGIDSMGRDRISIISAGSTTINDGGVSGAAIDNGGTWIKSGS